MSEMVERVARALALSAGSKFAGPGQSVATRELGWRGDGEHIDKYVEKHWREHIHAAEFAIEAMREPTDNMIEEGAFVSLDGDDIVGRQRARECYRAMTDAALGKVDA